MISIGSFNPNIRMMEYKLVTPLRIRIWNVCQNLNDVDTFDLIIPLPEIGSEETGHDDMFTITPFTVFF